MIVVNSLLDVFMMVMDHVFYLMLNAQTMVIQMVQSQFVKVSQERMVMELLNVGRVVVIIVEIDHVLIMLLIVIKRLIHRIVIVIVS
jgi:hypothetical protein